MEEEEIDKELKQNKSIVGTSRNVSELGASDAEEENISSEQTPETKLSSYS